MTIARRDFITLIGGAAAWPLAARAQRVGMPLVAFVSGRARSDSEHYEAAFRKGLNGAGFIEGQNVTVEYHWLNGQYDKLSSLMTDFVSRRVDVIAAGSAQVALAAKAATTTIPIVFVVGADPVNLGLVATLARPGGNATGINFFAADVTPKRLGLLHELIPKAARIAVLVNPADAPTTTATLRDLPEAAHSLGMQMQVFKASSIREIDQAFAELVRTHVDGLFVAPASFLTERRVQLATLSSRHAIPTSYSAREAVETGGLMSYGADNASADGQAGDYVGRVLKGAKPSDLPVQQSTKFEFVINLSTARALDIAVPPDLLTIADEVIE
jgi:putative ABC transport system substrate-binding protein